METVRTAKGKNSIPLTEDDKRFVKESKRRSDVSDVQRQPKRRKLGPPDSNCEKFPEPETYKVPAKTSVHPETDVNAVTTPEDGHSNMATLSEQPESGTSNCEKVPESPVRLVQANIPALTLGTAVTTPGVSPCKITATSAQSGFPVTSEGNSGSTVVIPDFYNPESPLFTMQNDFIHDIVTDNVNSSGSSTNLPSSSTGTLNTASMYAVPQPVNFNVLNSIPGGANLGLINQSLGDLPLAPSQPSMISQVTNEWQRAVWDTLIELLSNQKLILNELKSIKQNTAGTMISGGNSNFMQLLNESDEQEPTSVQVQEIINRLAEREEPVELTSIK